MRSFDYIRPESITEAIAALAGPDGSTRALAGGTDLLTLMKSDVSTPERLVDIKRLPELDDAIDDSGDGIRIGALATLAQLEDDLHIQASYTALSEAAAVAATPQLRNMATIGGNLLQRPRCWYFRSEHVQCWLNGGEECYARDGENQYHALFDVSPCVAVHPSDLATALVALDASITVRGAHGDRDVPLGDFFAPPQEGRRTENTLAQDELIVAVTLPRPTGDTRSTYLKAMDRKVWAFALVGVGASVTMDGDAISGARLVLGGVAPVPRRAEVAEAMLAGAKPSAELFARVADTALADATPLAKNGYKVPLLRELITRALASATGVVEPQGGR
ncbi:MAG TPA: xanthine dehydrogenase family protein subunit M [Thermomicrobiales bacterium]|nr:xanthine dehydrogenase family protein subunit M [Thermomicrobiales bacterium]